MEFWLEDYIEYDKQPEDNIKEIDLITSPTNNDDEDNIK